MRVDWLGEMEIVLYVHTAKYTQVGFIQVLAGTIRKKALLLLLPEGWLSAFICMNGQEHYQS